MNKIIKFTSQIALIALVFGLFAVSVKADELTNNSSNGIGAGSDLTNNSSNGIGASGDLTNNSSNGIGSTGDLTNNSSNGTGSTGGLSNNSSNGIGAGSDLTNNSSNGIGATPSTPVTPPADNGGGSTGGSTGGGGSYQSYSSGSVGGGSNILATSGVQISNFKIVNIGGKVFRVSWTTNTPTIGRVVYGTISHTVAADSINFGYEFTSNVETVATTEHVFAITALNAHTFLRPIATIGTASFYGKEFDIQNIVKVINTTVNSGSNSNGSSMNVNITNTDSTTVSVSTTTIDHSNEAAAGLSFSQKIGNFFKKIWHFIIGR